MHDLLASNALALSPEWLKQNLARYLWRQSEVPGEVIRIDILRRRASSKRGTVLYQVELKSPNSRICRQMYTGYVVPTDGLSEEYQSLRKKAKIKPPVGRAVALIAEANLILLSFPNARKMTLLSEEAVRLWLQQHWHEATHGSLEQKEWQVQQTRIEMLQYVPDKRFTACCRVRIQSQGHLEKEVTFIAKQLKNTEKANQLCQNLQSLCKVLAGTAKVPLSGTNDSCGTDLPARVPRALGADKETSAVFIEYIPGRNLVKAISEIDLKPAMLAVGELLANLHAAKLKDLKPVSYKSELAEVHGAIGIIVEALPHLRPRLERLFREFQALTWDDNVPDTLLHGTFKLQHFVLSARELVLLDWESLRVGHPAYDLANFIASLYYLEARAGITPSQRQNITRYFLQGYVTKTPWVISAAAVLWFLVSLLLNKQAPKSVLHFHRAPKAKVERILAVAEGACAKYKQLTDNNLPVRLLWQILP